MNFYLPENLDLENLIYNSRPNFKPFKFDKARYIIHLLNALRLIRKDLLEDDFIPINAQKLQRIIQDYKQYLDYLENDLGVIESDKHYVVGEKSKGFRLTKKYRVPVVAVPITDFTFRKKIKIKKNKKIASLKKYQYLTKWFNKKLEINIKEVNWFINEEYYLKYANKDLWDYNRTRKKYKNPLHQFNHAKMSAEKLKYLDYFLKRDENVHRFHNNLSTMRSVLRNAITYDGNKLISIDIKNSQPYLSTLLLDEKFWFKKNKSKIGGGNASRINKLSKNNNIININDIKILNKGSYIMLGDIAVSPMNKDFRRYIQLVINGGLYEFLEDVFTKELGESYSSRREIKSAVFQVLFTDNRFIGQKDAKPKKVFKKYFPDVYGVFAEIKRKDKTLLPRLLQGIESYLIIDIIAKRISLEYPKAPIFTIHDSIATTEEYVGDVERIMNEELTNAIGYAPTFTSEEWDIENMKECINKLNQRGAA